MSTNDIELVGELLLACKMLLKTCGDTSWLHLNGEKCTCKSCARKYARQVIEKAKGALDSEVLDDVDEARSQ